MKARDQDRSASLSAAAIFSDFFFSSTLPTFFSRRARVVFFFLSAHFRFFPFWLFFRASSLAAPANLHGPGARICCDARPVPDSLLSLTYQARRG